MSILDEVYRSYINMTEKEACFYEDLIVNCPEIVNSKYHVNGVSKCNIVEMTLRKDDCKVNANGSLSINGEYRCFDINMYNMGNSKLSMNVNITRLCVLRNNNYSIDYSITIYDIIKYKERKGGSRESKERISKRNS